MSNRPSLDDYIDVAERIAEFNSRYPEGSLQSSWHRTTIDEKHFIVCEASAYRSPEDPRPGQGIAWEPFPGPTPYTKNSELMNAQTSAWGRAIVAVGLSANRSIASKQEVRARAEEQKVRALEPRIEPDVVEACEAAMRGLGWKVGEVRTQLAAHGAQDVSDVKVALRSLSRQEGERLWSEIQNAVAA